MVFIWGLDEDLLHGLIAEGVQGKKLVIVFRQVFQEKKVVSAVCHSQALGQAAGLVAQSAVLNGQSLPARGGDAVQPIGRGPRYWSVIQLFRVKKHIIIAVG